MGYGFGHVENQLSRCFRTPVRFKVVLQLAAPGDKIDDPSEAWASTNKITTLGMLTVASVVPDSEATERALMFLAGALACRHRIRGPDDSVPQQDLSGILRAPPSVSTRMSCPSTMYATVWALMSN